MPVAIVILRDHAVKIPHVTASLIRVEIPPRD
jgi:hypothetical protein